MKRLIIHVFISLSLFLILSLIFTGGGDDSAVIYIVNKADGENISLINGDGYQCVGGPIEIIEMPDNVRAGDEVFLTFKGESYTEYRIKVYYPSGASESKAFSQRKSDGDGSFGWEFTVSRNTGKGKLRLVVYSDKSYLLTEMEIVG